MEWFKNLRIGSKLFFTVGTVLALTMFLGFSSFVQMGRLNNSTTELGSVWLPNVANLGDINAALNYYRRAAFHCLLSRSKADIELGKKYMDDAQSKLHESMGRFEGLIYEPEVRQSFDRFKAEWVKYDDVQRKAVELAWQGKTDEAFEANKGTKANFDTSMGLVNGMIEKFTKGGAEAGKQAETAYVNARFVMIVVLVSSVLIGLLLATFVERMIRRALENGVPWPNAFRKGI